VDAETETTANASKTDGGKCSVSFFEVKNSESQLHLGKVKKGGCILSIEDSNLSYMFRHLVLHRLER